MDILNISYWINIFNISYKSFAYEMQEKILNRKYEIK